MKSKLFVRPNLKLFLLGAFIIALVHDLALTSPMEASGLNYTPGLTKITEQDLEKYVLLAESKTDPELFMRISYAYEKRGDPRKALLYLRKAERCTPVED